jgi:hypothetical protein
VFPGINTQSWVAGGDDDTSMIAMREEFIEVDLGIIGVVEEYKPSTRFTSEPFLSCLRSCARVLGGGNVFEPSVNCFRGATVNQEDIGKTERAEIPESGT